MEVGAEEHLQPHSPQQHPRDRGCVREVGAKGLGFRLCQGSLQKHWNAFGSGFFPPAPSASAGSGPFLLYTDVYCVFWAVAHPHKQILWLPSARFHKWWEQEKGKGEKGRQWEPTPPIMSPCASAAHHTCGTLNRPLKYYDMEKITLCFNLSTKEQSNYRAKHSRGRPNKEKSKKIWWKFLRGLTMFNHASGLN